VQRHHAASTPADLNSDVALFWVQEALMLTLLVAAPILGVALAVGLAVSILQAITSVQEMTLSFIPKILAAAVILILLTPWMLEMLGDFMHSVFAYIPSVSR
jgi:flagellar biosynthetic protein FliQ